MSYSYHHFRMRTEMVVALEDYARRGVPLGSFLAAVVANDLTAACSRADPDNLDNIPAFAMYLLTEMPQASWGSREKVTNWIASFTLARREHDA